MPDTEATETFDIVEAELVDTTPDDIVHAAKRMLTSDTLSDDASYYDAKRQARRDVLAMFHSRAAEVDITLSPYEAATFDLLMNGSGAEAEHLLMARWDVPHQLRQRWVPGTTQELPAVAK
jgi:hypothetical protein